MTRSAKQERNTLLFFVHERLPISYWQRSTTPGVFLWVAQAFRKTLFPFGGFDIFSTFGHDAMSIVECLRWQTFAAAQDDAWSTEAKSGVPRYDGEVSRLAEYQFRVRLRQAREKAMDESEVKKLGPLALRLVDGLRGPALQVARALPVDRLAGEDGTSVLLKALQSSLQPRSRQEARDLYQIGAQQGGVLSRQQGESIPSYVLRRKAWYNLMLDMDSSLKLPEAILAEQTLQNSGISSDHQLLIRAAVHGDVTMEKICEELVAQHSRVHEHELRRGKGGTFGRHSNYGKSFNSKGYGKDRFRSWSRAYHVQPADEYYDCEDWESHSQSLGGYEEFDGYHVDEAYAYVNDEDEVIHSVFMNMLEEGLDEQDPEAAEYAAEVLQTEAEAFFVRDRAGQTGHRGFGGSPRHFQVQGHLTMEERKARVQALKAKTQCRVEKDWRGSTGTTWQWKCKTCGHVKKGQRPLINQTGAGGGTSSTTTSTPLSSGTVPHTQRIAELFSVSVELQNDLGGELSVNTLDKIYEKCKSAVFGGGSTAVHDPGGDRSQGSPSASDPIDLKVYQRKTFANGTFKGQTFQEIYSYEKTYVKTTLTKFENGNLKDPCLIEFAKYCKVMKEQESGSAYMVSDETETEELYVILDTGCNNTCHGSRWMEKFMRYTGMQPELMPAEGRFRGVGGKVEVSGKRSIPVCVKTLDDELVPGNITSIELDNSDTPLLLSSNAQKSLGFVLDMSEYAAYSKTLDKELEIVNLNGLPALRLHPGDENNEGIAMVLAEDYVSEENEVPAIDIGTKAHEENLTDSEDNVTSSGDSNETASNETDASERHLPLHECSAKTLSKGQKKMLCESLDDMEKEDCAMWSTLQGETKRHKKMLPRGCRSFMKEIFAGAATLSLLAVTMGLSISAPVDIEIDERYNLLQKANRDRLWQEIEDDDPYLLTLSPLCAPWSSWQRLNATKSEEIHDKIMMNRKEWYPVIAWIARLVERRLELGREVLLENPWPSLLWQLKCFTDMMDKQLRNQMTGEPLELIRLDQCMYGLVGEGGLPHQKATGMLLSSARMKARLCALCDGQHHHEQLEGNKTRKAQQWPQQLCKAILESALEEMKSQVIRHAFPAEFEMEEREGADYMDGIHDLDDVAEQVHKRRRIDLNALDTEEDHEQSQDRVVDDLLRQKEKLRKEKWLKISREERIAVRRLHQMMGHCSNQALVRMLRMSLAKKEVIDAAQHFRCQSCDEMKSDERPRTVRPINPCHQIKFNDELAADVFEVVDCKGARRSILSLLDMSTHYHVAVRVAPGGTPSSKICAEAINASWLSWAGAPRSFVCDQGVHNRGRVAALLQSLGTEIRRVGARAPHQLGTAERHGGMLKEMMKRGIHDRQLFGSSVIAALCSECARAKNVLVNNQGFSPAQWVLGHTPEDLSSLTDQDPENHLGVHQGLVDAEEKTPQEQFMLQLLMRQTAKEMYTQVDSSQRIRRALLRKAVPIRGPYHTGDLVCFSKQGKWYGPARVLTTEGKSSLWLVHGGVTVLVAETSCRPASTQEILKKHVWSYAVHGRGSVNCIPPTLKKRTTFPSLMMEMKPVLRGRGQNNKLHSLIYKITDTWVSCPLHLQHLLQSLQQMSLLLE